ncbi:MAG: CHASE2 domain-containing protein [Betaproteobacteria bacterium]|nr:CHASE2 domain-containing protein [Betaproteobacteria bacterium]
MKSGFWKTDWFFGLVVALLMLLVSNSDLLQSLERKAYDMGVTSSSRIPLDRIAVIAIDDVSIANLGRWPWSREIHAKMADILAGAKTKVIGNTVFFTEPQIDPGYQYIVKLLDIARKGAPEATPADATVAPGAIPAPTPVSTPTTTTAPTLGSTPTTTSVSVPIPTTAPAGELGQFVAMLREAEGALNTDRKLADSFERAKNVLLPMLFTLGDPRGKPDKALPEYVARNAIAGVQGGQDSLPLPTSAVQFPIETLGKGAVGLGHLNANPDVDGGIRTESLVLQHFDQFYPSLSMMIAAKSLNLGPADIKVRLGEGVSLGKLKIGTDQALQMHTYFYKDRDGRPAFQVDSFYDVYTGKIEADKKYRDKIVLIGATAAGVGTTSVTPISPAMFPVLTLAHSVSSILQEHFFVAPTWGWAAEKVVFLLVAVYLVVLLPRLKAGQGAAITAGILVALLVVHFVLMTMQATWIQLMVPCVLLVVGHVALITKRFMLTESGKVKSDASSAESNRMLGLAYQGQGQLDMAWDKFRSVPLSDDLMDNLYNLALDFERKRQFSKAEGVFRHMAEHDPKFRDIEAKLSRAKQLSETVILGGSSGGRTNVSILSADMSEKPMLGRYQVEKELGKGAMGVVYLGKDPKIGRVVAIKTMNLSQEFEADELAEVKERFFREAETAGRLAHQNIVTIYDAGEEHDLAFIAMELLKGGDLAPFTKPGALLPIDQVVSIISRTADALGYAHKQNVVHRDIKPANIMYHPETDTVKVTDFGIARLTDSSKTKTGMVLGTPSYMSPEQLSGKKIDGRSDLFSLAVSLYQMLCGKLPFEGDSMAQLMFRIAGEPHIDILTINPNVPPAIVAFLEYAMAKNPDTRFQTGEEFAAALREAAGALSTADSAAGGVDFQL